MVRGKECRPYDVLLALHAEHAPVYLAYRAERVDLDRRRGASGFVGNLEPHAVPDAERVLVHPDRLAAGGARTQNRVEQ